MNVSTADYKGWKIRYVTDNAGKPWWVMRDVFTAMGYSPGGFRGYHCPGSMRSNSLLPAGNSRSYMITLSVEGVAFIASRMIRAEAVLFMQWLDAFMEKHFGKVDKVREPAADETDMQVIDKEDRPDEKDAAGKCPERISGIIPFEYEGKKLRTIIDESGVPWWVAKDVCDVLGILSNYRDKLAKTVDDDEKGVRKVYTLGGYQSVAVLSESGVFSVIYRCGKPEAKRFRKWFTAEVLTALNGQTGMDHGVMKTGSLDGGFNDPENRIIPFTYETKQVRTLVDEKGESWWVAKDVCDILGIYNCREMLAKSTYDDEKGVRKIYTLGGYQNMAVLNESGVFSLIFRSGKPEAKKFRQWFTTEALTAINNQTLRHDVKEDTAHDAGFNEPETRLIPFTYEKKQVRTLVDENGESWWVAKDVCKVLGFSDHKVALRKLDEDERGGYPLPSPSGIQNYNIINESGLYTLIIRSNKPEARKFRKWVTSEVLPAIRRTGRYETQTSPPDIGHVMTTTFEKMKKEILAAIHSMSPNIRKPQIPSDIFRLLPENRAFTEFEAACYLNSIENTPVSLSAISERLIWSHKKTRKLIEMLGGEIRYPRDTSIVQNQKGLMVFKRKKTPVRTS